MADSSERQDKPSQRLGDGAPGRCYCGEGGRGDGLRAG